MLCTNKIFLAALAALLALAALAPTTVLAQQGPEPPLTDAGILVLVLIILLIIGVGASLIDFKSAMMWYIVICHFAGIISKKELLIGYSNPGITAVAVISVLIEPIARLPLVSKIGRLFFSGDKDTRTWQLAKILVFNAIFSNLIPNAPHAILMTPIIKQVSIETGMHPRYALLPMSVIIGAANSLVIASASNLVTSGILSDATGESLGMVDLFISNAVPACVVILMSLVLAKLMFESELENYDDEGVSVIKKSGDSGDSGDEQKKDADADADAAAADAAAASPALAPAPAASEEEAKKKSDDDADGDDDAAAKKKKIEEKPSQRTIVARALKGAGGGGAGGKKSFLGLTKFTGLFQIFQTSFSADALIGQKAGDVFGFLPPELRAKFTIERIIPRAAFHIAPGEQPPDDAVELMGDDEKLDEYVFGANDRIAITADVGTLRAVRGLLGVAWVGISDMCAKCRDGGANSDDDIEEVDGEIINVKTPKEEGASAGNAPIVDPEEMRAVGSANANEPLADNAASPQVVSADGAETSKRTKVMFERNALYQFKQTYDGLDAFLPVDVQGTELKKVRFALVVVAHNNPAVGQRLESRLFSEQFRCAIVSVRRHSDGFNLYGRQMALHVLHAGDAMLLRLRPHAAPVFTHDNLKANFYDVEGLGDVNPTDKVIRKSYVVLPQICHCLPFGESVITKLGKQRVIKLPEWFDNITLLLLLGVIIAAAFKINLTAAACAAMIAYVLLGFVTPTEAIQSIDWTLISSLALSFGLGTSMQNSGLASYLGYNIGNSGATGFAMVLLASVMTGAVASIVSNKGAIQILYPLLQKMFESQNIPAKVAAVITANCCVAGFMTVFGSPSHMVINASGGCNYTGKDFFLFGLPCFIVYLLLTSVFVSIEYSIW